MQVDKVTPPSGGGGGGAEDLRICAPLPCQRQQQLEQQQNANGSYHQVVVPGAVSSELVASSPPVTVPASPVTSSPLSLGLVAPHTGPPGFHAAIPTLSGDTSDTVLAASAAAAGLNVPPMIRPLCQTSTPATRRRVSDKTGLPISTGNELRSNSITVSFFACERAYYSVRLLMRYVRMLSTATRY